MEEAKQQQNAPVDEKNETHVEVKEFAQTDQIIVVPTLTEQSLQQQITAKQRRLIFSETSEGYDQKEQEHKQADQQIHGQQQLNQNTEQQQHQKNQIRTSQLHTSNDPQFQKFQEQQIMFQACMERKSQAFEELKKWDSNRAWFLNFHRNVIEVIQGQVDQRVKILQDFSKIVHHYLEARCRQERNYVEASLPPLQRIFADSHANKVIQPELISVLEGVEKAHQSQQKRRSLFVENITNNVLTKLHQSAMFFDLEVTEVRNLLIELKSIMKMLNYEASNLSAAYAQLYYEMTMPGAVVRKDLFKRQFHFLQVCQTQMDTQKKLAKETFNFWSIVKASEFNQLSLYEECLKYYLQGYIDSFGKCSDIISAEQLLGAFKSHIDKTLFFEQAQPISKQQQQESRTAELILDDQDLLRKKQDQKQQELITLDLHFAEVLLLKNIQEQQDKEAERSPIFKEEQVPKLQQENELAVNKNANTNEQSPNFSSVQDNSSGSVFNALATDKTIPKSDIEVIRQIWTNCPFKDPSSHPTFLQLQSFFENFFIAIPSCNKLIVKEMHANRITENQSFKDTAYSPTKLVITIDGFLHCFDEQSKIEQMFKEQQRVESKSQVSQVKSQSDFEADLTTCSVNLCENFTVELGIQKIGYILNSVEKKLFLFKNNDDIEEFFESVRRSRRFNQMECDDDQ